MAIKSVSKEADDIFLAGEMIRLGARLQVLQAETDISHDRLARLYREIRGCSPPKGMLPFSVDWFMTWLPNIHSSLFYNVYSFFGTHAGSNGVRATIDAYRLYLEHVAIAPGADAPLSFTRAWMLVRFFDSGMLQMSACQECGGQFVTHAHDPKRGFVCAICRPPPRAGKTRAAAAVQTATLLASGAVKSCPAVSTFRPAASNTATAVAAANANASAGATATANAVTATAAATANAATASAADASVADAANARVVKGAPTVAAPKAPANAAPCNAATDGPCATTTGCAT